jgi:hypothetical protein
VASVDQDLVLAAPDPERPSDAARHEENVGAPLVHPGRGHRAAQLLKRLGTAVRALGEREDRGGVDRHLGLGVDKAVPGEDLFVVRDDPVVDPDHAPVPDGVVVRLDRGVALGVVANVDEHLGGVVGDADAIEERTGTGALLANRDAPARAVGIADGVGATLGDSRQQSLGGERAVEVAVRVEVVSGDSAHIRVFNLVGLPDGRVH